ncbi:hypothetical protein ALO73_200066 [Pseudomonas syringae pv. daphniphylli]|uniref:Glutamate carboxypeptidase n=1 Tax=Pseudomonas syringae pv. daphniphylli TaxID=264455 RepID=A0A9X0GZX9_PSESX|nr:hypothetical protein ALO73_200066 [Pseudomonas syringae pv. daphniphylli]
MIVDPDLPGIAQLIRMISPVSPCALMAADEFERVMAVLAGQNRRRAFSDRSISAARLVLVMGASVSEAALETGLTRQVVHRLMARIRARLEDFCRLIGSRLKPGFPLQLRVTFWLWLNHSDLLDRNRRGVPWLFEPRCSSNAGNCSGLQSKWPRPAINAFSDPN